MAIYCHVSMIWLILGTAATVKMEFAKECSFTLMDTSSSVMIPTQAKVTRKEITCIWKLRSIRHHKFILEMSNVFSKDDCEDCSCGNISLKYLTGDESKVFCPNDLPADFETDREVSTIQFNITSAENLLEGPLFAYHFMPKKSLLREHLHPIRVKRDSEKQYGKTEDKEREETSLTVDVPSSGQSGNDSVSNSGERSRFTRLPVILPAVLTVVIFIACLLFIGLKMYNADEFPYDRSLLDLREKEVSTCLPKRNRKKHTRNELYDVMLKEYKAESHRKNPLRKSSTIKIEGYAGNDPQTIAKKHLLLNKIRNPSSGAGAVGTLIKLSSTAFIASSMVRDENESSQTPVITEESHSLLHGHEHVKQNCENHTDVQAEVRHQDPVAHTSSAHDIDDNYVPWIELDAAKAKNREINANQIGDEVTPDVGLLSPDSLNSPLTKEQRNSGPVWFKYKRLEKQPFTSDNSDEELDYDCAQHIHRILSASRENIDEARRILPDDVKSIFLPQDLETALAEFDLWPDSTV